MAPFTTRIDAVIDDSAFSGVVRVARGERVLYARASGFADRAHNIQNTLDTQFGIASGTKALTALAVMSLVGRGAVDLDAPVQSVLAVARDLVEKDVTVRHLLAHSSGMGDYLDEDALKDVEDYVLEVPVHRLASAEDFLLVLRGRRSKFAAGTRFSYCNSGYVLLALVSEAVSGRSYHDLVRDCVCVPAGMHRTAFFRLDELPGSAAIGYLATRNGRSNHLHLPVRGVGDGGAYSTAEDLARLWHAIFAGQIVPLPLVHEMLRGQHEVEASMRPYGLGFWLPRERGAVCIEGCDAGISFRSRFDRDTGLHYTVLANTSSGAWPVVHEIEASLPELA